MSYKTGTVNLAGVVSGRINHRGDDVSDKRGYIIDIPGLSYQLGVERELSKSLQATLDGWVSMMAMHGLVRKFPASYADMRKEADMRIADLKHVAYPPTKREDETEE